MKYCVSVWRPLGLFYHLLNFYQCSDDKLRKSSVAPKSEIFIEWKCGAFKKTNLGKYDPFTFTLVQIQTRHAAFDQKCQKRGGETKFLHKNKTLLFKYRHPAFDQKWQREGGIFHNQNKFGQIYRCMEHFMDVRHHCTHQN